MKKKRQDTEIKDLIEEFRLFKAGARTDAKLISKMHFLQREYSITGVTEETGQYFAAASFAFLLWNEYSPSGTERQVFSFLIGVAGLLCEADKEGVLGEFLEVMAYLKYFARSRMVLSPHFLERTNSMNSFIYNCVGSENYEKIIKSNTIEIRVADMEKYLISQFTREKFYKTFFKGVPNEYWYNSNDEDLSRYHWILSRMYPDVREAMTCSGIPYEEQPDMTQNQKYTDAFSDVMRQTIMSSLSGEIKVMKNGGAGAQRARQFVLKFMMDADMMSKAYVNVARIESDKLPSVERSQMYRAALLGPDVSDPEYRKGLEKKEKEDERELKEVFKDKEK